MKTTKVFRSGNSQAVRLPAGYRFKGNTVEIIKHNHDIILREIPKNLSEAFKLFTSLPDDFYAEDRVDTKPQSRDRF